MLKRKTQNLGVEMFINIVGQWILYGNCRFKKLVENWKLKQIYFYMDKSNTNHCKTKNIFGALLLLDALRRISWLFSYLHCYYYIWYGNGSAANPNLWKLGAVTGQLRWEVLWMRHANGSSTLFWKESVYIGDILLVSMEKTTKSGKMAEVGRMLSMADL